MEFGDLSARRPGSRDRLLVASEVAELLRVTTAWVYAATRANQLPHVRLGRYVRYRESAVLAWLDAEEQGGDCSRAACRPRRCATSSSF